jgi:hypothetical protein
MVAQTRLILPRVETRRDPSAALMCPTEEVSHVSSGVHPPVDLRPQAPTSGWRQGTLRWRHGTYSVSSIVAATFTARIEKPILARRHSIDRARPCNTHANEDLLSPSTANTPSRSPRLFERRSPRRIARCFGNSNPSSPRMGRVTRRTPVKHEVGQQGPPRQTKTPIPVSEASYSIV